MASDGGLGQLEARHLPRPDFRVTRIETGGTSAGVPDVFYAHRPTRTSGWIENKQTQGWAVEVRPLQIGFHLDHAQRGVRTFLAVRARGLGSGGAARDGLYLYAGTGAALVAEHGLRLGGPWLLGRWLGTPAQWDWSGVEHFLTGGYTPVMDRCSD